MQICAKVYIGQFFDHENINQYVTTSHNMLLDVDLDKTLFRILYNKFFLYIYNHFIVKNILM